MLHDCALRTFCNHPTRRVHITRSVKSSNAVRGWGDTCRGRIPEAKGQGKTREACLESVSAAIELVLNYRREESRELARSFPINESACTWLRG